MRIAKQGMVFLVGVVMGLVGGVSFSLGASDYPAHYIEVIIPYTPGAGMDMGSRIFKDKVEKVLGQPLVYTYKPGATGVVGSLYAKGCKPDGYTLLVAGTSSFILPPLTKRGQGANYTMDDFTPVCTFSYTPSIFCVKKDGPYMTMQDFIQAARTKKLKYSTTGVFGGGHITMEALSRVAGFQAIHLPYSSGAGAAMTAVLGGHADISLSSPAGIEAQLRIVAVDQEKRAELLPDVPTLKELGYPISKDPTYYSLWAPKGTPREAVDKIYASYKKALEENKEEIRKRGEGVNHIPVVLGPEELLRIYRTTSDFFREQIAKMGAPTK